MILHPDIVPQPDQPEALLRYRTPRLMGIVNVTPDSFSDGGDHYDRRGAIEHALRLLDEGADIIDVGGESSRPPGRTYGAGAAPVPEPEELRRVLPVIEALNAVRPTAIISIDTMKPNVARLAVQAGASIINDVSAGRFDPAIWEVAAEAGVDYVLMHGHDPLDREQVEAKRYRDVVSEVYDFLAARIAMVRSVGVQRIIADVGLGFAKGPAESVRLLREHRRFLALGVPMLVGPSRKAFVGGLMGGAPPRDRLFGTLGAVVAAALNGGVIVRVHDVAQTRQLLNVLEALVPGSTDPGAPPPSTTDVEL